MTIALRTIKTDDWLMGLQQPCATDLPLQEILAGSLFYPASGVDSDPVKHLKGYTTSFVYCDYGVDAAEVAQRLRYGWCEEYEVIDERPLSRDELAPEGFRMPLLAEADPDPQWCATHRKEEFATWFVFQLRTSAPEASRPRRFSVLYLGADGIAAFNELYVTRRLQPAAIAIIQPGHGCGTNYTNFENPDEILARLVLKSGVNPPDILMFGGGGDESRYANACWPTYLRPLGPLENRSSGPGYLRIWTCRKRKRL